MFEKLCYFLRYSKSKFKKQECPSYVTLINNLPEGKKKYVNRSINLCDCIAHDCIIIVLYFDGFFETNRRFFGEHNYWFED